MPMSALVSWGRSRNSFPCFWARYTGRPLCAQSPDPGDFAAHPLKQQGHCSVPKDQEKTHVFGDGNDRKCGRRNCETPIGTRQGSTRAGPQSREGVKLGELRAWNWLTAIGMISAAIKQALKGVEGTFVMLPAVWAPSPDYKEAKGVIANYVEALTKAAPPRVVALSSMGANRTSGLGMITALSLLEQGFRDLTSPIAFVRAGGFFENFLYGLQVAQGGNATGLLQSDKPEIDHGRDGRHRRGSRNPFDRASLVRTARRRALRRWSARMKSRSNWVES